MPRIIPTRIDSIQLPAKIAIITLISRYTNIRISCFFSLRVLGKRLIKTKSIVAKHTTSIINRVMELESSIRSRSLKNKGIAVAGSRKQKTKFKMITIKNSFFIR